MSGDTSDGIGQAGSPRIPIQRRLEGLRVSQLSIKPAVSWSSAGARLCCHSQGITRRVFTALCCPDLVATICCLIRQLPCELPALIHTLSSPGIFFLNPSLPSDRKHIEVIALFLRWPHTHPWPMQMQQRMAQSMHRRVSGAELYVHYMHLPVPTTAPKRGMNRDRTEPCPSNPVKRTKQDGDERPVLLTG